MKYKALICDFDGTLVRYGKSNYPSKIVLDAINEASKHIYFGIATGRPLFSIRYILSHLPLTSPCILSGGAQIYDPIGDKVRKEYPLDSNDLQKLLLFIKDLGLPCVLNNGKKDFKVGSKLPKKLLSGVVYGLTEYQAEKLLAFNYHIPSILLTKLRDWKEGRFEVNINHTAATKQHGISTIAQMLKINTHEIISIGDSYNDFPLLMASGFKVAMGNAFPDLKEIADYVAPAVTEDGVADVIEKFILN